MDASMEETGLMLTLPLPLMHASSMHGEDPCLNASQPPPSHLPATLAAPASCRHPCVHAVRGVQGMTQYAAWNKVAQAEFVGLWLLTLLFVVVTAWQAANCLREALSSDYTWMHKWQKFGNLLTDCVVACMLLAACVYYSVYMAGSAARFSAKANYRVYDAATTAKARWWLPLKRSPAADEPSLAAALQVRGGGRVKDGCLDALARAPATAAARSRSQPVIGCGIELS